MAPRLEGWEGRLTAVVGAARARSYVLGEHDCLRVACQSVEALTGIDLWPRFAGYKTRRAALVTIRKIAPTLAEAVSLVLDVAPSSPAFAQRGDIVLYRDVEDHLGVCVGGEVAVLHADGLLFPALDHPGVICAWRVG